MVTGNKQWLWLFLVLFIYDLRLNGMFETASKSQKTRRATPDHCVFLLLLQSFSSLQTLGVVLSGPCGLKFLLTVALHFL